MPICIESVPTNLFFNWVWLNVIEYIKQWNWSW
jgi:hypothetical protein